MADGGATKKGSSLSPKGDELEHRFAKTFQFGSRARIRFYQRMHRFTSRNFDQKKALESMQKRYDRDKDPRRAVFRRLVNRLQDGRTFAEAIAPYIPTAERMLIAAGHDAGDIPKGFDQAIFVARAARRMRGALIGQLSYPAGLLLLLCVMLFMIATTLVPTMLEMAPYASWPPVSKVLYGIAMFITNYGIWASLVAIASSVATFVSLPKWRGRIRAVVDRYVPPWTIYREYQASTFLISLAALVSAGRPVDRALSGIAAMASPWLGQHVKQMLRALNDGVTPGRAVNTGLLNKEVVGDIEDYGSAGAFDEAIGAVGADAIEDSVERISTAAAVARNLMLFLVAGLIVLMYLAMVMLIMKIAQQAQLRR